MNKKLICVMLSLALMAVSSLAFATGVPSKTTEDMTSPVAVASDSGATIAADFIVDVKLQSEKATEQLASITAFVSQNNVVVDYFGAAAKEKITELLTEDTDIANLTMNEFFPVDFINYNTEYGSMSIVFNVASVYQDGQAIVAMLGIQAGDSIEWIPLAAEVVGGQVIIHFTQEAILMMESGETMIAILG